MSNFPASRQKLRYNPRALLISTPKIKFSAARTTVFAAAISTALLALPQSASAAPLWPDSPVTPTGKLTFILFVLVFAVGAIGLIAYVNALREGTRAEVDADAPAPIERGTKGTLIAGVSVFAVLVIAGGYAQVKTTKAERSLADARADQAFFKTTTVSQPGLRVARVVKIPAGPVFSVRVNAQQFLWRYEYAGLPNAIWRNYAYNELVLPRGVTVMLDFTSSDVEAAWWVPALGGSIAAIPGYDNRVWLRADKVGVYEGAGTVVNGTNYASMTTRVRVVEPAVFAALVVNNQLGIDNAMEALARTVGGAPEPVPADDAAPTTQEKVSSNEEDAK